MGYQLMSVSHPIAVVLRAYVEAVSYKEAAYILILALPTVDPSTQPSLSRKQLADVA